MTSAKAGQQPEIGIMGSGAIGLYVGGMLAHGGAQVAFAARGRTLEALGRGLAVSRHDGFKAELKPDRYAAGPATALADCDIILFCTKSGDTESAARDLAASIKPGAMVISLQNGVGNVDVLKSVLPGHDIIAGTVPFNVVRLSPNAVHCAMEGAVLIGASVASARLVELAASAGLKLMIHKDLESVQWGKLLLNLNNGLNVLSGLPLRRQFEDPGYRHVLALAMEELLAALDAAGIKVTGATRTNPRLIPKVLRLPSWLFRIVARQQLRMDDIARSSSWDDLQAGRAPETRFLNGAVAPLARAHGRAAPVNDLICRLVDEAFAEGRSPRLPGEKLLDLARKAAT
ncbi:MAG: 2-dehydropantoate 2-reductase [Hoeflea sp.]|uniref:2-dehydropantoate 2-reductase n=1 Tax=Hoeflea sp. TaxID=1940281 RepID=UPI001D94396F|nr:2-dehydropantoate 2-reductase [Hoeflea sp.]MBU4528005.1 2-dehydropantoate 2-reductase [Alphaproteobacteria bacterium]MBU4542877.1 2-dehydropantoate 2-reductase [Alphaproteobacteria bacterium]MBU4551392.1 2-dehydropantoate 2-reductase [Alphaproteobacteria bacterium]MBV1722775.1 2-dehydropantoate 2-reductase [Hoeflea sp.]MBV1761172.1 2-dehydropantoate 2-reductase [Hoeflea sp.]